MRIVITGANRGIGLELVKQYIARGDTVDAATRDPENAKDLEALKASAGSQLRILACDVTSRESVRAFAHALGDTGIDLLINNAGVMEKPTGLEDIDDEAVAKTLDANSIGPLRVTAALLPLLRKNSTRKIAHISSDLGSIAGNASGGFYGYRMSKAAINMASKSMANDLRNEGFTVITMHPGWVQTDMGGPRAPLNVETSARGLIQVLDHATKEDTGKFLDYQGSELPW